MPLSISTRRIHNLHTGNSGSTGETTSTDFKKIIIGICAMQRKSESKPMRSIMNRMVEYYKDYLDFLIFPEEVILNESVEKWPLCDCLISFHSTDFPLKKAIEYEKLRRPYVLNDLQRQFDLLDRRKVFRTLARAGIDHPRHCMLLRNEKGELVGDELHEFADHIEVNGMIFNKPFVEKPINAEDHNIYIYFPSSVGGGSQRLFRKVNDRSSWYSPVSTVRPTGSYIYEEFIPADGTDVKVYAVGPYYAHAEARKAPGLDGKVERDSDGKEVRYPVILTAKEKTIARRVVLAFGQSVCGFDLLRANGRSYVCDVNGFSFVKSSTKYYEDTAKILGNTILRRLATSLSIPWHIPYQDDDPPLVSTPSGKIMELRCVLAVIRHGDRTPKQKMKVAVTDERFFKMFQKYDGVRKREIKMKKPNQLMEVLEIVRQLLGENQEKRQLLMDKLVQIGHNDVMNKIKEEEECKELERELEKCEESIKTWEQMRTVLEMYGHFSGINRKVQLKYFKPKTLVAERLSVKSSGDESNGNNNCHIENNKKLALEINDQNISDNKIPTLFLILKWGGELTTAGVLQAEALGKLFRTLYPGIRRTDGKDSPEDTQGLGFLRLHSTYRHDLKIYASDEGRVQMTAAAFAKGLLALEGELTPILMQMVKSANTDGLLNDDYNARQFQNDIKRYLHSALQVDRDFTTADFQALNPSGIRSLNNALEFIRNPRKMCHEIAGYVQRMCDIIRWHKLNNIDRTLYLNESWELAERRWGKELREFSKPSKTGDNVDFDISKIPDIYDNIKYDMEHNPDLCINNEGEFERFYMCVKNMADIVVPQEYGIDEESKISIAQRVCTPLLAKIRNDLHRCTQSTSIETDESLTRLDPRASEGIATPMRHVRTRLYFTSESHLHTLVNLIRYGGLCSPDDKKWQRAMNFLSGLTEFNYMTQLVMMVYEDSRSEKELQTTKNGINSENNSGSGNDKLHLKKNNKNRFHIELLFSPGLYPCFQTEKERIYESRYSNRHKISTDSKHSTTTTKGKNNSGGAGPIGNHSSTGTSNGENHGEREMSETNFDQSAKSGCAEPNGTLTLSTLSFDMDIGAQSDYSQASEAPTRKTSTALQPSPKDLNREDFIVATSIAEQENEDETKQNSRDHKESTGSCREHDNETDEDDLTEENAVNLVVLDEVSAASHGKGFTKHELARHSPPSGISAPIRKRHATYERNPEKTPEHKNEQQQEAIKEGTSSKDEFYNKKQQQLLGTQQEEKHRKTSIEELMRAFFNKQANRIGGEEATFANKTTNKHEKFGKRTKEQQQSKSIIKSMSDASMSDSSRQKLSLDEADELEEDEKNAVQYLGDGINELELDENQATVGHDRGQWVKQLADNNRKDSAQQIREVDKAKDAFATTTYTAIFSSTSSFTNGRVPLAKIFMADENSQKLTTFTDEKPEAISKKVQKRLPTDNDDSCGNETVGITFDVHASASSAVCDEQKINETKTGVDNSSGGLKLTKIDNKPSSSTIKDEEFTEEQNRTFIRRPRFPYRFKHHTVNLLTSGTENKLISTDVLMGKFNDKSKRKASNNSVVLATAVIGRSSSAPRLQTYSAGDELRVTEIRRFWPPLRSLETMHDNLSFKEIDQFLERMMKNSTPLPSPPKTPNQYESLTDLNKLVPNNSLCTLSPLEH